MARGSKARRYVTRSVLILILGAGLAGGWYERRIGAQAGTASGATPGGVSRAQPRRIVPNGLVSDAEPAPWAAGVKRLYAANFSSTFEGEKGAPGGALTLAGSATLSLVSTSSNSERVVLQGTLTDISLVSDTEESEPKHIEDSIGAEISNAFVLTLSASGNIESLGVDHAVQGLGFNILRTLVASLQFVEPTDPNSDRQAWVAQETDQNGRYNAYYRELDAEQFEKRKEYTFLDLAARLQLDKRVPPPTATSAATITRLRPGVLARVQTRDSIDLPMGESKGFHSESHITIALKEESLGAVSAIDAKQLVTGPLFETRALDVRSGQARRDRELVGGRSFDELQSDLDALPPTNENREARWAVTRRMTALFNTDPASIDRAVLRLRGSPKPGDSEVLLAALSDANAPQAQAALARAAQDAAVPEDVQQAAIIQLSLDDHPTADTMSELNRMAQDPADPDRRAAAILALGGAVRHSAEDQELGDASRQAAARLVDGFKAATTPDDQALYLAALGNTGSPQGVDSIEVGLANSSPKVRAAAVSALRSINGPAADALIIGVLASDPDPTVRGAAVQAMRTRPLTRELGAALAAAARTDRAETVRLTIVGLLADKISESQAVVGLLAWIAQNDPDPSVKDAAATVLNDRVAATR